MIEDLIINTLATFGYPVKLQGSLLPDENYPEHFFTFWNSDTTGESFYNNEECSTAYQYAVYFYSTDPELVYSKLREAKTALKSAGFIVSGDGFSVQTDEQTHDGRGMNVMYLQQL